MFANFTGCTTFITICITVVCVNVIANLTGCTTFITSCIAVVAVNVIANFADAAADVTIYVASIIVLTSMTVVNFAARAFSIDVGMGKSFFFIAYVGVSTYVAGVSGITNCGTCRSGYTGFVSVSDFTGCTANVTSCIAVVVVNVFADLTGCAASVTSCIASVVVNMFANFTSFIAFVTGCIASIVINVLANLTGCAAFVTGCVTSIAINVLANFTSFIAFVTGCIASIVINVLANLTGCATFVTGCIASVVVNVLANFTGFTAFVTICITVVIVNVLAFRCVGVNDVELDGVDHCSYATGDGGKGNGLVNRGVNSDSIVCAIIGVLCQSILRFVNGDLGGFILVFCNVNNNLYYFLRNGEGKGSGFAGGTQLNAGILLCVVCRAIDIGQVYKRKRIAFGCISF